MPHVTSLIKSLVEGAAAHCVPAECYYAQPNDNSGEHVWRIHMLLKRRLEGEVATRSRLGCSFELGSQSSARPVVSICVQELQSPDRVVVHLEDRSLCTVQVEGAACCYDKLSREVWKQGGCNSR